jgi:hypothetical protein
MVFYTSEHLKWDAFLGVISKRNLYPTLYDLKCPIPNRRGFKHQFYNVLLFRPLWMEAFR